MTTNNSLPFYPAPKPQHNRRVEKRGKQGKFSEKTVQEIFERDHGRCVRCGSYRNLESRPHHVVYRSSLGKGSKANGVTICRDCHDWAHESKKHNNVWFVDWVEEYLDEAGEYKKPSPFTYGWHD